MQQSEYMAIMQGDDRSLSNTELIAAYEQGIDGTSAWLEAQGDSVDTNGLQPAAGEHRRRQSTLCH